MLKSVGRTLRAGVAVAVLLVAADGAAIAREQGASTAPGATGLKGVYSGPTAAVTPLTAGHQVLLVAQARENGGSIVTLQPPRRDDYAFTATISNGRLVVAGFVPDDATRKRIAAMPGVNANGLALARGEPSGFADAVEFGLAVLAHLGDGSFELRDGGITLTGHARTAEDFAAIESLAPPRGLDLAMGGVRPPIADPFVWTAEKAASGAVTVTGFVPGAEVRRRIGESADVAHDETLVADGAPDGFADAAIAGLNVLATLPAGTLRFDGERWTLDGEAETSSEAFAADSAFKAAGLDRTNWTFNVDLPDPEPLTPPPAIADYSWTAEKLPAGTVALSGYVPNEGVGRVLAIHAGDAAVNSQDVGSGAPDDFSLTAVAGVDALLLLNEGRVAFSEGRWSLSGRSDDAGAPAAVTAALGPYAAAFDLSIDAPPPAPPVADPFVWSAVKTADGAVTVSGYQNTPELAGVIAAHVGSLAANTTELASGAPEGFTEDVVAGLDALDELDSGELRFDGSRWSLVGAPATMAARDASLAALNSGTTPPVDWTVALAEPPVPPVPEAEPEAETDLALREAMPLETPTPLATPEIEAATPAAEPETLALVQPDATPVTQPETTVAAVTPEPEATTQTIAPPPSIDIPDTLVFAANRSDGGAVSLVGEVPTEQARSYFGVVAGKVSTDEVTLADTLPEDFIPNADAGLRLLTQLQDGRLGFDGRRWYLEGTANTESERAALEAALSALPQSGQWATAVGVTPPEKRCTVEVAGFAADNPILFQSGSARMTDESLASLGALAADLGDCPAAQVYVEGHTDADGPDELNLALSVARAEAVVDALVELGVPYQRLYAVGYGESLPIASNDTAAGKRANRRIVFTIEGAGN